MTGIGDEFDFVLFNGTRFQYGHPVSCMITLCSLLANHQSRHTGNLVIAYGQYMEKDMHRQIIQVSGHQHRWLSGGYDLETGHFQRWIALWLPGG